MRWLISALLFLLVLAIQTAVASHVVLFGAKPDLLLILVVQVAFLSPRLEGVIWAWVMGLIVDLHLHDGNPCGLMALVYAIIALGVYRARGEIYSGHLFTRVVLAGAAAIVQQFLLMIFRIIRGHGPDFLLFWKIGGLSAAYTAVVAAGLMPLVSLLLKRFYAARRHSA